jgi:hypothetical protein
MRYGSAKKWCITNVPQASNGRFPRPISVLPLTGVGSAEARRSITFKTFVTST